MTDVAIPVGANYVTLPFADVLMLAGLVGHDAPWENVEQMANDLRRVVMRYPAAWPINKRLSDASTLLSAEVQS